MAWTCPACQTQIRYDGDAPRPGRLYRCHICRLELAVDEKTGRLKIAPWPLLPPDEHRSR
jgi:hypothetical protein